LSFSTSEIIPVGIEVFFGSLKDITTFYDFKERFPNGNVGYIFDRGFTSYDLLKDFRNDGIHYIIPLKKNSHYIDLRWLRWNSAFQYRKRTIRWGRKECDLGYAYYFKNPKIRGEEEAAGSFPVTLEVLDNNGAVSEDTLTIEVSKSIESDDEEMMSSFSWILMVIIIGFLVVIGFLVSSQRDEALYKEMKAEEADEEAIVVEGVIDNESFKPKIVVLKATVEVTEDQDGTIAEVKVGESETNDDMYKPPDNVQKAIDEIPEEQD